MTNDNQEKALHPQILRMKKIAEDNGGQLLDMEWKGTKVAYSFLYYKNDTKTLFTRVAETLFREYRGWPDYENSPHSLQKNQTNSKTDEEKLKKMRDFALKSGAKLKSTEWKGIKFKYEFEMNGEIYNISYQRLSRNWNKEFKDLLLHTYVKLNIVEKETYLKEIASLAKPYNFELLSTEYTRKKNALKFLDKNIDEIFYLSHKAILEGKFENQYYGKTGLIAEPVCKQALEHLFGLKFEKRQDVLTKEITGRNTYLELDGYCEELKIAFEYQGHPSHWDKNHYKYEQTYQKDEEKKRYCKQLGITLLQIPNLKRNRDLVAKEVIDIIVNIIQELCSSYNIPMPTLNKEGFIIDYDKISHSKTMLKKLECLAKENNAKLISQKWKGQESYYEFEKDGETFSINYKKLVEIGWPANLKKFLSLSAGHKKTHDDLIEELKEFAKIKNFLLLDNEWKGWDYKYRFQSLNNKSVIFEYTKESVNFHLNKENSNYLGIKAQKSIDWLKEIAEKNNATLLSPKWNGKNEAYEFKKDNKVINFKYEYLKKKGWPQNLDKYLKLSEASKLSHLNREV